MAEALSTDITIDDDELEDCRWFTRDEVIAMAEGRHDIKLPASMAIARQIIQVWLDG